MLAKKKEHSRGRVLHASAKRYVFFFAIGSTYKRDEPCSGLMASVALFASFGCNDFGAQRRSCAPFSSLLLHAKKKVNKIKDSAYEEIKITDAQRR